MSENEMNVVNNDPMPDSIKKNVVLSPSDNQTKFYVKEFKTLEHETMSIPVPEDIVSSSEHDSRTATLIYKLVSIDRSKEPVDVTNVPGRQFLYEDYSYTYAYVDDPACTGVNFIELVSVEVPAYARRHGLGTKLFEMLKERFAGKEIAILAEVGALETACEEDEADAYIDSVLVPFFNAIGFTDMNKVFFSFDSHVPMVYPKEECERIGEAYDKMYETITDPVLQDNKVDWKARITS